ncbi:hypothetical protein A2774_05125 [Candidatus Roizmanbacteria bacterium RIFCSPHIGHO2_01_FULL_39_12c]|uniref:Glycosyltransferase 2-like domain-containing protein n=1 Tax=Candidatus Roizmanbacteria bacterium RIFCSPHIGHO2_01_FULL_39_12c TaxID=1802031 RepID=A0A1F7GDY9_9BACT|nr:MAG: hypothetical protein A2774_05125 [Candidatus Roizmanbacteria bacterium RIFCSPHIGHO2_01_FULL_39_12c]OGK48144.1 MAG: hypothetical protein A2963_04325 [Candidatus Roizmanbacteria bacterium RIFCSPLOWO2_01_FULL_40_13]
MRDKIQFTLILACYNEGESLKETVEISRQVLSALFKRFEIIVIDDDSFDNTYKIGKKLAKKYAEVKLIKNPINLGQGISFLIGLREARGELVMQNGADRPFNIKDLTKILPLFPEYDIIIVERKSRSAYSFWRKFTSWGNILLRGIFFGFEFQDLNFVQVYKKKAIADIKVLSRSAAFTTQELVLRARAKGYRIAKIRFPYHKRVGGEAHHGKKRDILWALIDMFNFWLESR